MSQTAANPIPKGFHTLAPYLVCKHAAEAIEFYKKAFGATELFRLNGPGGSVVHCCMQIGDSPLMLTDECPQMAAFSPQHLGGTPVTIHLSVADSDAAVARAAAAGARVVMPVTEMFWGARYGVLTDPFGHCWSVATQVRDLTPEQIQQNMATQFCQEFAQSA
jgi:PhnB protein